MWLFKKELYKETGSSRFFDVDTKRRRNTSPDNDHASGLVETEDGLGTTGLVLIIVGGVVFVVLV